MPLYGIRALCVYVILIGIVVLFSAPPGWSWQVVEALTLGASGIIGLFSSLKD